MKTKKVLCLFLAMTLMLGSMGTVVFAMEPNGTITHGYTRQNGVWGEAKANAEESFCVELYAGDEKIATTTLNNIDGIIDGDVFVTWSIPFAGSNDEYWTVKWEEGYPTAKVQPTKVVLYSDGVRVAENDVQMNAPDNLAPVVWTELEYFNLKGEGTKENPYLINNLRELKLFRDKVNDGETYHQKTIKVTADIDLGGEEWTPIGNATNKFEGYFDGNNKTISNLLVSGNNDYAGFFGYVLGKGMDANTEASVKNLTLDGVSVSGGYRVGGLSGQGYRCKIENVTVKGNVSGTRYIGGLIGHVYTYFDNCHFIGDVSGTFDAVGGIAGAGDGRVYNSSVIGDVTGSNWVGGIIANGQEGTSVVGCYVKGTVSTSNNFYFGVGGIAGVGGHGYNGSVIKDNYFDGEVFLCGKKVDAIVVGFINAENNASIGTTVDGNSWNTEYYPADTPVVVTAEVVDANSSPEDWAASASAEKSSVRNNNLVMLESDLEYVDAASAEGVAIMTFSEVSEEAVVAAVAENKFKVFVDANENGVLDEGEVKYTDVQEAIKAAAPDGTIAFLRDATVEEWVMFAESLTIGNDDIITLMIDGLTINGNGHTLTINSIESASNGGCMFFDATEMNINDLTIKLNNGTNGIGLKSGTLKNVNFIGGGYGVLPLDGDVTIADCTFDTNSTSIYFEETRDNLTVTGCTFKNAADANVILLRGSVEFTNNTVISGRTVNVVSGSPVVTGNDFGDVRFKIYNDATGEITNNTITNLVFDDADKPVLSTFAGNTLSESAREALEDAGVVVKYILTFNTNGGSEIASVIFNENEVVDLSEYIPEKEGYGFEGWYSDEALSQKITEITLDASKTIYAKWIEKKPISVGGLHGGSGAVQYMVTFQTNGGSAIEPVKVKKGEAFNTPAEPVREGFVFAGWYTDEELTNEYDFAKPVTKNLTLYANWVEFNQEDEKPADTETTGFTDLNEDAWYYEVVNTAIAAGLMNGVSATEFAPDANLTRGMFVTILYRADGKAVVEGESIFADVEEDRYYTDAVIWAAANGIVSGMTKDTFAPDQNITREQMATMISRYLACKEIEISKEGEIVYTDSTEIADWAVNAVAEMKRAELLEGNADGSFAPKRNATRAEAAALFVRLLNTLQ